MIIGISKSKSSINYYIIKDYTKNCKRSTKHVTRLEILKKLKRRLEIWTIKNGLRIM